MKINKWIFLGLLVIYSVLAVVSFVATSGGWTGFFYVLPGTALIFLLVISVSLIFNFVLKNKSELVMSKGAICSLMIFHILAVLFNEGDCGDGTGSYQFLQVLVGSNGWHQCNTGKEALMPGFALILFGAYFVVLMRFLLMSYQLLGENKKNSKI